MIEVVHVAATPLVCCRREHIYTWVGNRHRVPPQETGGPGSGCGGIRSDMSSTQHSNVCHRTVMADTQILEHSGGSGLLAHENRLLRRVPFVHELCLPTVVIESAIAGNHVPWRLSHSEKMHRAQIRLGFFEVFRFFSSCLLFSLELNLLFCCEKRKAVLLFHSILRCLGPR